MLSKVLCFLCLICLFNFTSIAQSPIAAGKSKFLGNIYSNSQQVDFEKYWNQVTPENAGKWGQVEAQKDVMNWTELDAAYDLAKDNGFPFKLHVLIWGSQQPSWMSGLSSEDQLIQIEEWFSELATRYPAIDFVEVVNEPLHAPPAYKNALGGDGATGFDWIITSFEMAREYFPNAILMINEYSILNDGNNTNKYTPIIKDLKNLGLIDAVGVQGHAFSTTVPNSTMDFNLKKLEMLELPIYVTELDIDGPTDEIQLEEYKRIFTLLWTRPSIKGITLWGWRPGLWRHDQKAYIMDLDNETERPALIWLRQFVENTTLSNKNIIQDYSLEVWPNPTSDFIHIKSDQTFSRYNMYNFNGEIVKSSTLDANFIDLTDLNTNQYYILELITENQASVITQVLKL